MAEEAVVDMSEAKKSGRALQWKGLRVEVPGSVFFENGTTWNGVVSGLSQRKTGSSKNRVFVKFDGDEREYWFDKKSVLEWLTDKAMAEALRPTLQSTGKRGKRRSGSQSESSLNPDSSHLTPSSPPPVNGGSGYPSSLGKIPEAANGTAKPNETGDDQDETSKLREEMPVEETEALPTPSASVVRRFRSWVSEKFQYSQVRGIGVEDEDVQPEDEDTKPLNAETDEEMLDEEDLKRLSGAREENNDISTPPKVLSSTVWVRMKDVFYTPFSSSKMRARKISSPEGAREEGDLGDDEAAEDEIMDLRVTYEQPELRMLNDVSNDSGCVLRHSPLRKRRRFLSFFGTGSPMTAMDDDVEIEDEAQSAREERAGEEEEECITDEGAVGGSTSWHPVHIVFTGAVLAAWASCAYYGWWTEEAESG